MERPNAASPAACAATSQPVHGDDTVFAATFATPERCSIAEPSVTPSEAIVTVPAHGASNCGPVDTAMMDAVMTTSSGTEPNRRMIDVHEAFTGTTPEPAPGALREASQLDPTTEPSGGLLAACAADAWHRRLTAMFLVVEEGPVASGHDSAAATPSLTYVMGADESVRTFWEAHSSEVKRLCAPSMPLGLIDMKEVLGFALADGLNRPLIPHDRAGRVGQAGLDAIKVAKGTRKKPGVLTRAKEAAREAVRSAKAAALKDATLESKIRAADSDGAAKIAAVLDRSVDLKIPNETVGAKRKRPSLALLCPAKHTMTKMVGQAPAGYSSVKCDGCSKVSIVQTCSSYFHCAICQYDLCDTCAAPERHECASREAPSCPPAPSSPELPSVAERELAARKVRKALEAAEESASALRVLADRARSKRDALGPEPEYGAFYDCQWNADCAKLDHLRGEEWEAAQEVWSESLDSKWQAISLPFKRADEAWRAAAREFNDSVEQLPQLRLELEGAEHAVTRAEKWQLSYQNILLRDEVRQLRQQLDSATDSLWDALGAAVPMCAEWQ